MKNLYRALPWFLLYSRLASAVLFAVLAFFEIESKPIENMVFFLFCFGFIGDIFDGIIARRLRMDTTKMRRLDSLFDSFFWFATTVLLYQYNPEMRDFIAYGLGSIITFLFIEYIFCLIRFQKLPSAHNFLSKYFGLFLFILYVLIFSGFSPLFFGIIVVTFGFIARFDSLLIYIILKKWTHDIPSSYHAVLINKGIDFKRNTLFHSKENKK